MQQLIVDPSETTQLCSVSCQLEPHAPGRYSLTAHIDRIAAEFGRRGICIEKELREASFVICFGTFLTRCNMPRNVHIHTT